MSKVGFITGAGSGIGVAAVGCISINPIIVSDPQDQSTVPNLCHQPAARSRKKKKGEIARYKEKQNFRR